MPGTRYQRLDQFRLRWREEASKRGVDARDVDLLLADAIGRPVSFVVAHGETAIETQPVEVKLQRRFAGEPLQYIRRRADFFEREFYVDDRVLIPRPETELLVEEALRLAPAGGRVIDVGCGSGCIAISVERSRPDLRVLAVDRSIDALAVARLNARRLQSPIDLAASDLLASIDGTFDLVLSNPPYIPATDVPALAIEVRDHEPRLALTPGERGTEAIERLFDEARQAVRPAGHLVIEIGFGQEGAVRQIASSRGFRVERVVPDLAAIPRVVISSR